MVFNFECNLVSDKEDTLLLNCTANTKAIAESYAQSIANLMTFQTSTKWSVIRII